MSKINPHDVVFLRGALGSGKTTFVKGMALGLGITSRIISPTFVIVREHSIQNHKIKTLYHLDLYRLGSKEEARSVDLKDFLDDKDGIVVIEWPDVSQELVSKDVWQIYIKDVDKNVREIQISYGN